MSTKKVCRDCRKEVECEEVSNLNKPLLLFLYALCIIPGMIYRLSRVHYLRCNLCKGSTLVPLKSKVARKILRHQKPSQPGVLHE